MRPSPHYILVHRPGEVCFVEFHQAREFNIVILFSRTRMDRT